MAKNRLFTVFQNLDSAINGKWDQSSSTSQPHINSYNVGSDNSIIFKTDNKLDFAKEKLELQQNAYLKDRWVKSNIDLSVQAFNGLNNLKLMYRDADLMDQFPEIGAALNILSEEASISDSGNGKVLQIYSKSDRIKSILEDLFVNRLDIQIMAVSIIRAMCKYGNQFMLLNVDNKNGVMGWRQLPVYNVERLENGISNPYGTGGIAFSQVKDKNDDLSTQFIWTDENNGQVPFRNWQVGHFRLINNSIMLPYGCLVGDTKIETENGYKEMSNILIGDKVWTFNIVTQEKELSEVTMFMPKGVKDVYSLKTIEGEVVGTEDHKFLVNNEGNLEYRELRNLLCGDYLVRVENGSIVSTMIEEIEHKGKKQTYDFTVANDNSNFFANGFVTHNCSWLNPARRHFLMLSKMEDMMLMYRLERSIERRVYKIFVGNIDDADVQAYVQEVANNFKRTPIIDPMTGQIDLRKNLMGVNEDLFLPTRTPDAPTPIDTLSAAQNLTAMDDIKFVQNKVLTALQIPKSFLNFEDSAGDGKNLALMDIRFTRTINRVQQAFLMELNKIAMIHLYLLGFTDDLNNFTLAMNNPSTQAEQLQVETLAKRIGAFRDAVSDPGTGIPAMSMQRAAKEILKWSEKDIKDNLEEIRLEKALAAELEKTTQIIKKTGIFDSVDRIYGEPGAKYQDDQQQGAEGEEGMDPGGGMGGGMDMGGMDMGADMGGEGLDAIGGPDEAGMVPGEEGEVPMDTAAGDMGAGPMEGKKRKKPIILEKKNIKHKENQYPNTEIYDKKSFMLNEEFDKMINSLNSFTDDIEKE